MAWPLRVRATVADQRPLCSRSRAWLGDLVAGGLHCCDELLLHLAQLVRRVWAADQVFTKMSGKGRDGLEVVACDSSLAPELGDNYPTGALSRTHGRGTFALTRCVL